MWQKYKMTLPQSAKIALDNISRGIKADPFSLSIKGVKIGVHNWTHGIEEKSNKYLSPENAIKAIQNKLTDYRDSNRPRGVQDVVIIMLSSATDGDFMQNVEQLAELMPDPVFKQAFDYAKAFKNLATSKMVKTLTMSHPAFGKPADITPQSARVLNTMMRSVQALNEKTDDPFKVIEKLKQKKAEKQAEQQEKINKLMKSAIDVNAFCARGLLDEIALKISEGIPNKNHVFTAVLCFIGDDLTQLRGLLQNVH